MVFKLKQQIHRYRLTESNRLPNRRARRFLVQLIRYKKSAEIARAALGLTVWALARAKHGEDRISNRFGCFISGRARGASQRFSVARTKIQYLSENGKLFGTRKSS
jgi:ribosomal protein S14